MSTGFANPKLWGGVPDTPKSSLVERSRANPKVYKQYPFMDDVTPFTDTSIDEALARKTGKVHRYTQSRKMRLRDGKFLNARVGDLYEVTLEMCLNNINANQSTFILSDITIPALAKEANMTPLCLAVIIMCSEYVDTRIGKFVVSKYL